MYTHPCIIALETNHQLCWLSCSSKLRWDSRAVETTQLPGCCGSVTGAQPTWLPRSPSSLGSVIGPFCDFNYRYLHYFICRQTDRQMCTVPSAWNPFPSPTPLCFPPTYSDTIPSFRSQLRYQSPSFFAIYPHLSLGGTHPCEIKQLFHGWQAAENTCQTWAHLTQPDVWPEYRQTDLIPLWPFPIHQEERVSPTSVHLAAMLSDLGRLFAGRGELCKTKSWSQDSGVS